MDSGGQRISIRPVAQDDMEPVIELIQQISKFAPSKSHYPAIWENFYNQTNVHPIVAVMNNQIVGYGSVLIESKIRGGKIGHIEDIVSHSLLRNKGIGKTIINALCDFAKEAGCYKVSLKCKEQNVQFYEKCGLRLGGVAMQMFFQIEG